MSKKILMLLLMLVVISVSAVSAVDVDDNSDTIVSSADAESLAVENDVDAIDDLSEDVAGGDDVAYENSSSQLLGASDDNVLEDNENILAMANDDENDEISQNPNSDDVLCISIQSDSWIPSEITPGEQFSFYVHTDMPALKLVKLTFADGANNTWDITTGPRQTLYYTYQGQITGDTTVTVYVEGNDGTHDDKEFKTTIKLPTNITLEKDTMDLGVGDEVSSGATLTPADAGNLTYTSSNESVVKVENGMIKAVAEGNATITV